jgi:hypothetical protein
MLEALPKEKEFKLTLMLFSETVKIKLMIYIKMLQIILPITKYRIFNNLISVKKDKNSLISRITIKCFIKIILGYQYKR